MIGITGLRSTIAQELVRILPDGEEVHHSWVELMPLDLDCYFLCAGFLAGQKLTHITDDEMLMTWDVNFMQPARLCDRILAVNDRARIVVMGSQSGWAGSFDMAYAGAKAALHLYVETKKLRTADQRLICVAPGIVADSGMTQRRQDLEATMARGEATRAGRWIQAKEVAEAVRWALYDGPPFLSNTIIRLRADG